MPNAEILLWWKIRNRQIGGYKFRRQYGVYGYVVDFYCPKLKLAIEIDGETHITPEQLRYDQKRQKFIESLGIKFLRFCNMDVYENIEGVVEEIGKHLPYLTSP